jgi:hypothetical protein
MQHERRQGRRLGHLGRPIWKSEVENGNALYSAADPAQDEDPRLVLNCLVGVRVGVGVGVGAVATRIVAEVRGGEGGGGGVGGAGGGVPVA